MRRAILFTLLSLMTIGCRGQANGVYYSSAYANWQVAGYAPSQYTFAPATCSVPSPSGGSFVPFATNTPLQILDPNPALNEVVTPSSVTVSGTTCSISISPVNVHYSFTLRSATCGLQEAINQAAGQSTALAIVTPDFASRGCSTSTITAAKGNTSVSILDQRTAVAVAYTWNGSAYVAQSIGGGFPITLGSTPIGSGSTTTSVTGLTVDGVAPSTMAFLDATSSIQTQLNAKAPLASPTFTGTFTIPVTGSTQCLHVNTSGVVSGTGSDCGAGGGAVSSVSNSDTTLTVSPTTGAVVASLNLAHANTWTANQTSGKWIASTGFDISGAVTAGHYLRNNGTDYIDSAIQAGDVPTLNQSTTGNAATATTGTNLSGGLLGSTPYQSAANTTAYVASPTTSGQTFVFAWQPSGSAVAPAALNLATYLASPPVIGGTTPNVGNFSQVNTAASALTSCGSATGCQAASEGSTVGTPTAGQDYTRADSLSHTLLASMNGNAEAPLVQGPTSSTNNDFAAMNGITGAVIQDSGIGPAKIMQTNTPSWLQYLGTGADGANTTASGNLSGVKYYTSFTVPGGNTVTVNSNQGLVIHATGACTINGTIDARGIDFTAAKGWSGGAGGGGGGGAAAGTAGNNALINFSVSFGGGGSAGATSGGAGGNASSNGNVLQRIAWAGGWGEDGLYFSGAPGGAGGSSGGAAGNGGAAVILICASITGTGVIDVSGGNGVPAAANSTGSGGGGGAGVVILSSQSTISTPPAIYTAPGPGALATVPQALGVGGSCTSPPTATLGVTAGALSGTCTVVAAGAGCGTGAGVNFQVVGGGGTLGTGTVNPTWSGGTLASCTATAGTSTGYTVATFTTSGAGGNGAVGWTQTASGW